MIDLSKMAGKEFQLLGPLTAKGLCPELLVTLAIDIRLLSSTLVRLPSRITMVENIMQIVTLKMERFVTFVHGSQMAPMR